MVNPVVDCLMNHRSIRKFKPQALETEALETILLLRPASRRMAHLEGPTCGTQVGAAGAKHVRSHV